MPTALPVSADVGTFMESANRAEMRDALGNLLSNPNVAYLRSTGSDTTGDGSSSKPFLTAQKAYDSGFRNMDLGIGSFGNIVLNSTQTNYVFSFRGVGEGSVIGSIYGDATFVSPAIYVTDLGLWSVYFTQISSGRQNDAAADLVLTNVRCEQASAAGAGVATGATGANGGNLLLQGMCYIGSAYATGGFGGEGTSETPGGSGGNGGQISITGPSSVTSVLQALGGDPGADGGSGTGSMGAPGNVTAIGGAIIPIPSIGTNTPTYVGVVVNNVFVAA